MLKGYLCVLGTNFKGSVANIRGDRGLVKDTNSHLRAGWL